MCLDKDLETEDTERYKDSRTESLRKSIFQKRVTL